MHEQGAVTNGGGGPEGFAGTRKETDHHPSGQSLAPVFGLPENAGTGLCPGTVDHAFAGQTRPPALPAGGHPTLKKISPETVSKILTEQALQLHKVRYSVEKRDPQFEQKMAQVLYVYEQVQMLRKKGDQTTEGVAILAYDEKPGIQAVENAGGELPPVPGIDPCWTRDYEYVRHGTLSLLAGIDLLTGHPFFGG